MRSSLYGGLAVAAILTVGLVLVACGSSNDNSTTALSKAAFLKQGNAICKRGNQQINAASKTAFTSKKPSQAELNKFVNGTLIPAIQGQISGVKALAPPTGDEAKVKAIVDSAQAALDKGKKDPTLFTSNKGDPFAQANKLATAYGLTVCGSSGGGGNG
jgi:hypothetical protein